MKKEPSTKRLTKLGGTTQPLRLLAADRNFLSDLARVNIISEKMASKYNYAHLKGGATRSLVRMEAAGLIKSNTVRLESGRPVKTYQFANKQIARAWGGSLPVIGAKRNVLHELITSKMYYEAGRPNDFRVAAKFSDMDIATVGGSRPDALYTDPRTGELVVAEADSGNYTRKQIIEKIARWESVGLTRFAWGQPSYTRARVPGLENITTSRYSIRDEF